MPFLHGDVQDVTLSRQRLNTFVSPAWLERNPVARLTSHAAVTGLPVASTVCISPATLKNYNAGFKKY
jgi:hypothetical protein